MSFNAMQAALRTPGLAPTEKLVLIALADHVGADGRGWPAIPTLARDAGLSDRQVQRMLTALQARGLIHRQPRQRRNGARTSDLYVLTLPKAQPKAQPKSQARASLRNASPVSGPAMSPQPVTCMSPQPMSSTSPEREQPRRNKPQGTSEPVGSERARAAVGRFSDETMASGRAASAGKASEGQPTPPLATPLLPSPPLPSPLHRRRTHRCPPDYAPSPATLAFAEANGLADAEVAYELDRLKDHEFRNPRADWDAAFRNWLRTTLESPRHAAGHAARHDLARHPFAERPEGHWRDAGPRGGDAPRGHDQPGARLPDPRVGAAPGPGPHEDEYDRGHALALGRAGPATSPPNPRRASTDARRNAWIALAEELAGPRPG